MGIKTSLVLCIPLALVILVITTKCSSLNDQFVEETNAQPGDLLLRKCGNSDVNGEPDCCPSAHESNLVLISTLDGYITALNMDQGGDTAWSIKTDAQPLFESTIGNLQFSTADGNFRLIPSLDGNFYMYDDAVAQGIPVSAESLLSSSMKFGSDVISGGKEVRTFGLQADSGTVIYSYAMNSRKTDADASTPTGKAPRSNLVIKRTTRIIRAVEALTGIERWNVTVGEHEIFAPEHPSFGCDDNEEDSMNNLEFRLSPADGIIAAFNKSRPYEPIWSKKLNSPIAQLWSLGGNVVKEISLFDPNVVPYLPSEIVTEKSITGLGTDMVIYVGTYENEKYIIPSPEERQKLKFLVAQHNFRAEPGRLYLAANSFDLNLKQPAVVLDEDEQRTNEDNRCFENCPTCSSDEVHSLMLKDQYPRDMGWYLFKQNKNTKRLTYVKADPVKATTKQYSKRETFKYVMWTWWNIFLFVGAPTSLVSVVIWYLLKRLQLYNISVMPTVDCNQNSTVDMVHALSQVSESDLGIIDPSANADLAYESWYLNHFEPIRCLGKGGFGIVIESLNKLDQHVYAVKRIRVSTKPDGKERVQREVTALAKLDHPGIVRYYNSWLEEPPRHWQENWDRDFLNKCSNMPYCSMETFTAPTSAENFHSKTTNNSEDDLLKMIDVKASPNGYKSANFTAASALSKGFTTPTDLTALSRRKVLPRNASDSGFEIVFAHADAAEAAQPVNAGASTRRPRRADKELQTSDRGGRRRGDFLFIQMQLCHDQTLSDWLSRCRTVDQRPHSALLDWFDQIVCAVQYVHDCGLIHRDLKPSNIFFAQNFQLKIGDFGLAKCIAVDCFNDESVSTDNSDTSANPSPVKSAPRSNSHTDNVGTWLYMSPEQERGDNYTFKVDIYALGLIFFEMLTPFSTEMERRLVLADLKLEQLKFPADFELKFPDEHNVIRSLITHDPDQRWTCIQIRSSNLFAPFWPQRPIHVTKRQRSSSSIHSLNVVMA